MDPEIRLQGRKFDFAVPLDDAMVMPTAGGAKINEVARPEQGALTEYEGDELVRLDVPVFYDGWPRTDVLPRVMQAVELSFGRKRTLPDFKASGPMPYSGMRFQMEAPEWVSDERGPLRAPGGVLVRQALVLKFVEFNDPDVLRIRRTSHAGGVGIGRGQARGGIGPNIALTHVTSAGETLLSIAAHSLGDSRLAGKIGELNGIRDVRQKLPAGLTLTLPRED